MAKLKSNDLELEIKFVGCYDYDPIEYDLTCTLTWKGIPVLNEKAMKRWSSYWNKGAEGGIVGAELDNFTLIKDLEEAVETRSVKIWEAWPDPDMCISIYPGRYFPYFDDEDSEYNTIIVSPDAYQFKECDCYHGYEGVSFVMTPDNAELQKFIDDLKLEFKEASNKKMKYE